MSSRKVVFGLIALCALAALGYWMYPRTDYAAMADDNVVDRWLPGREKVDALEFFSGGGHFIDMDEEDDRNIDAKVVVPLIERLTNEANMNWAVLLNENREGYAFAILAPIPEDSANVEAMDRVIAEQEAKFDGKFIEQRGHDWLSFEFLSADEFAHLEGAETP